MGVMAMIKLWFQLTFKTSYHVGAGYGKDFCQDSALLREGDGTPVIRGSALGGVIRDGAYRLLELPPLKKYNSETIIKRLFGSQKKAKDWRISSAHSQIREKEDSQAVYRIRIDPHTRRTQPQKLFSQEEGIEGQVFNFSIMGPMYHESALDEAAFFVAAVRNVRQLGRSRRRGLGECVIHLTKVEGLENDLADQQSWEDWFLERFKRVWIEEERRKDVRERQAIKSSISSIVAFTGFEVRKRLILRLDEPMLISQRANAGNQFSTHSFIPGSTILGFLASCAARNNNLANSAVYKDFVSFFFRGLIVFPVLYPAYHAKNHLYPTIPAPLDLMTCKVLSFQGSSTDHGIFLNRDHNRCSFCGGLLEPAGDYLVLKKNWRKYIPERTSELHVSIDPETQRSRSGELYGYTLLQSGQYMMGEILCTSEKHWDTFKNLTGVVEKKPMNWWLGKGRQRGYGLVTAYLEDGENTLTSIQLPLEDRVKDPAKELTFTFLTDTIINNSWGQQATGIEGEWLERELGLGPLKVRDSCVRSRIIDGFHSTWGLPRDRDIALQAGSSAQLLFLDPPSNWSSRMKELEIQGIGLRRHEGFGRISFNHPVYEECKSINDINISLTNTMRLPFTMLENSLILWEQTLEEHLPLTEKLDSSFTALARWLYTHRHFSPEVLRDKIKTIGEIDYDLHDYLESSVNFTLRKESNKNFQEKHKDILYRIINLLDELQLEEEEYWPSAIERLAVWIEDRVDKNKRGGE